MDFNLDKPLSTRIEAWGKPHYKLWYFFAVQLINVYVIAWVALGLLGWLAWWVLPLIAFSSWILTISTQAIVGRARPKFEEKTGYKMWWRTYSLPSGHATISAAVATVILLQVHFPNPLILVSLAILFVIAEMLIGLGRIVVGVHYFGDVLVGFVLGIGFGVMY
ncbi:MAG: phosphatase PAP2 family protein [Patescibacteria group bacterium]|jgi:undecaprenyl-diphosphatase